jgi:proteinaceous RNase P
VVPEVVAYMRQLKIPQTEMTLTAMARAAAAEGDPERALQLAEEAAERFEAGEADLQPRLRTFTPALLGFCSRDELAGAVRVTRELARFSAQHGLEILLTEAELAQMLAACVRARERGGQGAAEPTALAAAVLEEMTENLATLSEGTLDLLRAWFEGDGDAAWEVRRSEVSAAGDCSCCGRRLQAIDLDEEQFKAFSAGISKLAAERERSNGPKKKGPGGRDEPQLSKFEEFSQWLQRKGPFDVVVDGANVAMYGQAKENHMQPRQITQVVRQIQSEQPDSRVLVVLHNRRVNQLRQSRQGKKVLEQLLRTGVLYATPTGSNDDWYWMHAVVKAGRQGRLISNDQMRDHIFQLLSPKFFPKWRERHQVTFEFWDDTLTFQRPAKFSTCIQRDAPPAAEAGPAAAGWHFPPSEGDRWLCVQPRKR